ncbi:MAG: hypothetical protein ACJAU0_000279 [Flavobacteriales bacterium]|jgi:hypothetical protein
MRITGLSLALLLSCTLSAQISIGTNDMPSENDSYSVSTANLLSGYDYTETGENFTWNYAGLETTGENMRNYIPVGDAPFIYQFLFNNPFDQDHVADYTINTDGFDVGNVVSFDAFYEFYQNDDEAYTVVGYGATINSIPVPSVTEPVDHVYAFPLDYQNTNESYSEWFIQIPTLGSYLLKQTRSYEVDGWGTLTTPYGTFETLKVRMSIESQDSVYIDLIEQGTVFERSSIEYHWLAEGEGIPILKVVETFGQTTRIEFKNELIPESVEEQSLLSPVIYPSITSDLFKIKSSELPEQVIVYDLSGRTVASFGKTALYSVAHLSGGSYVVSIQMNEETFTQNLRIVR